MKTEQPAESPRGSIVSIMLAMVVLGGVLLFLIVVSGGFFLYVGVGVGFLLLVGVLHYLTWGASMHVDTEGEREEERLRNEPEPPW